MKLINGSAAKNQAEARAKKKAEAILAEAKAYSEQKMASVNAKKANLVKSA